MIEENDFEDIGKYTAKLGDGLVWIANRPYDCFNPHSPISSDVRPSRYAIFLGLKKLKKQEEELNRKHIQKIINQF